MQHYLIILLCFFSVGLIAQKHDANWFFGYNFDFDEPTDSLNGVSVIDFNETPPNIYYDGYKKMDFFGSGMIMSDEFGNYLFSSDGEWIENHANEAIENDDILNFFEPITTHQASTALPLEKSPGKYLFLHTTRDFFPDISGSKDLHYSIIDMNENNGLGKVTELNHIVFSDTLDAGKLTAVKHGNGEDWWVVLRKLNSNIHFTVLFDGKNYEVKSQEVGIETTRGYGEACFSPDGSKYVNTVSISEEKGRYFDLYHFDRCKGKLSNHIQVHAERKGIAGGVAFSPNSRFLYIGDYDRILQYDTWATDIPGSETVVAEYDGYKDTIVTPRGNRYIISTRFEFMELAPDGKIYINTPASTRTLHEIQFPDKKGRACEVKQHALKLPTMNATMPAFPNYRLGALEGSPCDTITTSTVSLIDNPQINLYPNPAQSHINIEFETLMTDAGRFMLYDLAGRELKSFRIPKGQLEVQFDLTGTAPGMYFYKIEREGTSVKAGKLVVERL